MVVEQDPNNKTEAELISRLLKVGEIAPPEVELAKRV